MGIPELGKDALIEIFMKCQSFCALRNEMRKREQQREGGNLSHQFASSL